MSTFLTEFLNENRDDRPFGPRVHLGVFGKHPGWDDHFDLGIKTYSLALLQRMLYGQGIRAEIDGQTWERLHEDERLPGFDHWFIWLRPTECLIGYLWDSSDGKGRSLYPMIACAHLANLPLSWCMEHAIPVLKQAVEEFRTATTSGRVATRAGIALDELRNAAASFNERRCSAGLVGWTGIVPLIATLKANPEWLTPLYAHIMDKLHHCAPGLCNYTSELVVLPAHTFRVPAFEGSVSQNLNAWLGFLLAEIDPGIPTLAIMRNKGAWVDLVVGEPMRGDFFLLQAGEKMIPLATRSNGLPVVAQSPLAMHKAAQFQAGELPQISMFNNQPSQHNLRDAIAKLHAVKVERQNFIRRLFATPPPRPNPPLCGD